MISVLLRIGKRKNRNCRKDHRVAVKLGLMKREIQFDGGLKEREEVVG
jgi:hypothetical protein